MKKLLLITFIFPLLNCGVKKELESVQKENSELLIDQDQLKKENEQIKKENLQLERKVGLLEYQKRQLIDKVDELEDEVASLSGENKVFTINEESAEMFIDEMPEKPKDEPFNFVEKMTEFPGGEVAMYEFIKKTLRYPMIAKENGLSGMVYVSFIVEKDGSLTDIKVRRGLGSGCDEEAIRVIKLMPNWIPGKQRGENVRVRYTLPIRFVLR